MMFTALRGLGSCAISVPAALHSVPEEHIGLTKIPPNSVNPLIMDTSGPRVLAILSDWPLYTNFVLIL
ncbi:unnamed protein product [Trichogramma brassicae]|uniref:Uncharacterized protein n=1 Tax=Trichogramma brassicae TaxID=86971 RepID=A0A6H5IBA5_9HYME|nr:unnamed protein product [Trichogramma brassicae]